MHSFLFAYFLLRASYFWTKHKVAYIFSLKCFNLRDLRIYSIKKLNISIKKKTDTSAQSYTVHIYIYVFVCRLGKTFYFYVFPSCDVSRIRLYVMMKTDRGECVYTYIYIPAEKEPGRNVCIFKKMLKSPIQPSVIYSYTLIAHAIFSLHTLYRYNIYTWNEVKTSLSYM